MSEPRLLILYCIPDKMTRIIDAIKSSDQSACFTAGPCSGNGTSTTKVSTILDDAFLCMLDSLVGIAKIDGQDSWS